MGHAHWSLDCPCCTAMGVSRRVTQMPEATISEQRETRLNPEGFTHIYEDTQSKLLKNTVIEVDSVAVDVTVQEDSWSCKTPISQPEPLLAVVQEQALKLLELSSRLESASYRIGYLEALTTTREEEVKLLADLRARAAGALVHERNAEELAAKVTKLEAEIIKLRSGHWHKFACWFLGIER